MTTPFGMPTFVKVGKKKTPKQLQPPTTVKPPTESGNAPSLDPGDWETFNSGISSVDVTYPTGLAGDMIVLCGYESVGGAFTTPTGFTEVFYTMDGTDGVALYARIADGTESGTVSVPTAGANAVVNTNRIVANGATLSIAQIVSNVNSSGVNPPSITLTDAEYVVLVGLLFDGSSAVVNNPPTDYSLGVVGRFGSDIFGGTAQQLVTGPGTEDPATWDVSVSITTAAMSWTAGIQIDPKGADVSAPDHTHVEADVTDLDHTDSTAIHDNVAGEINAITEKATPVDGDWVLIEDSAASNAKKKAQLGNLPGGGGGGGGGISRVGRTTVGASWLGVSTSKRARKVSLTAANVVTSIGVHLQSTTSNVAGQLAVALFTDDSSGTSQPGELLGVGTSIAFNDDLLFKTNTGRWYYSPLGVYVPSTGDYWIAFWFQDPNDMQVAYDSTGGTAADLSAGGAWWSEFGATGHSVTSRAYDLSMHAVVLS